MSNLPQIDGKRMIKILRKAGFEVIRIKGSHHFVRHTDGRATVVPVHGKENIGVGLFHKILKDCELSIKDFMDLLEK
jgi:predicted RNA binding protein YcfA (HicA-like mRNA interferase family)